MSFSKNVFLKKVILSVSVLDHKKFQNGPPLKSASDFCYSCLNDVYKLYDIL